MNVHCISEMHTLVWSRCRGMTLPSRWIQSHAGLARAVGAVLRTCDFSTGYDHWVA